MTKRDNKIMFVKMELNRILNCEVEISNNCKSLSTVFILRFKSFNINVEVPENFIDDNISECVLKHVIGLAKEEYLTIFYR